MGNFLVMKFLMIPGILIAFTVKEYVRAVVAYKLGDKSQKLQGKMTLDPFAHIDLIGFILIIFCGFGWSKQTEVNRYGFKNPKKDSITVTLAAFSTYLVVAFIAYILAFILGATGFGTSAFGEIIYLMLILTASVNISLFVFNLIPIPGLEMHTLLIELAPSAAYKIMDFTGRNNILILLCIVFLARYVLAIPVGVVQTIISTLSKLVVGIFI
ncbi:MAG: site-2 protease family protein [Sarcina sp.]